MQLNTIAGRTYNDLSQYPVVRVHSLPPLLPLCSAGPGSAPCGRWWWASPEPGPGRGWVLPDTCLCSLPLPTPSLSPIHPLPEPYPLPPEGKPVLACFPVVPPSGNAPPPPLPVGSAHLLESEGWAYWAGRPSGPSHSSFPGWVASSPGSCRTTCLQLWTSATQPSSGTCPSPSVW